MQKLSALILFLFAGVSVFAQLTVKPSISGQDNFLYVKDRLLFVAQGIELQKNAEGPTPTASIYFRSGGQLVQGADSATGNTGDGFISIFQEGTSNAYDYNYWAAPVGTALEGNGAFGIGMLHAPLDQIRSQRAEISEEPDGSSLPLKISSRWIHTYAGSSYSNWKHIGSETGILSGYGFTMKGVNGTDPTLVDDSPNNPGNAQRYDFRGKPNNGRILIPLVAGEHVLIGNPYPSALDLSLFLLENSGTGVFSSNCYGELVRNNRITGIAYFWDSKENGSSHNLEAYLGGYGAFSPVDPCTTGIYERPVFKYYAGDAENTGQEKGNHYERRYLPIAQGFMVEGTSSTSLEFSNRHRIFKKEGQNSDFKNPEKLKPQRELITIPKIRLQVIINDSYVRTLSLGFWPTATNQTDFGMDAKTFDLAATDVGWLQNNESFTIDVRPFQDTLQVPLYLQVASAPANISFSLAGSENFEHEQLFLVDALSGTYVSLKKNPIQLTLNPGNHNNRFHIAFRDKNQLPPPEEPTLVPKEGLSVFQDNKKGQLEIRNPAKTLILSLAIFDLHGRAVMVSDRPASEEFFSFPTRNLPESLYFVKLSMKDGTEITEKILILARK